MLLKFPAFVLTICLICPYCLPEETKEPGDIQIAKAYTEFDSAIFSLKSELIQKSNEAKKKLLESLKQALERKKEAGLIYAHSDILGAIFGLELDIDELEKCIANGTPFYLHDPPPLRPNIGINPITGEHYFESNTKNKFYLFFRTAYFPTFDWNPVFSEHDGPKTPITPITFTARSHGICECCKFLPDGRGDWKDPVKLEGVCRYQNGELRIHWFIQRVVTRQRAKARAEYIDEVETLRSAAKPPKDAVTPQTISADPPAGPELEFLKPISATEYSKATESH
ncbi:MAG TPA: hypothetical protein VKX17_24390 [Planctomycetota bacterium]|nr:hypothetical protein [Planctomycetota bacterium]